MPIKHEAALSLGDQKPVLQSGAVAHGGASSRRNFRIQPVR